MMFGIVGLDRLGRGLATRALDHGHETTAYDRDTEVRRDAEADGIAVVESVEELVKALDPPRVILLYGSDRDDVDEICDELYQWVAIGDVVADGSASHWEDAQRRATRLGEVDAHFVDVGTMGGVPTAQGWRGAAFTVGGEREAFERVAPLLRDLAADERAVFHAGATGAGHFASLVHDAVASGMVQAIAEGVEMLETCDFGLDVTGLFRHWTEGTLVQGRLVDLMADALEERPDPESLSTYVEDTGEVKWLLDWALRRDIPTPVVSSTQQALMAYRDLEWPAAKAVALLRNAFGAHPVHRIEEG